MMTSGQVFDTTLPDLDTHQVSTQSDIGFVLKWCVKFAPLRHCHVTPDDVMMTSCQFFDITLPNLDTYQVSTQSDLGFVHNWCVKFAPLRHCHVTSDDVMITKKFCKLSVLVFQLSAKYELDRNWNKGRNNLTKTLCYVYGENSIKFKKFIKK